MAVRDPPHQKHSATALPATTPAQSSPHGFTPKHAIRNARPASCIVAGATKRRPDAPVGLTEIQMRIKINDPYGSCAKRPAPRRAVSKRGFMPAAQYQRAHPPADSGLPHRGLLRALSIGRRRNPPLKSTSRSSRWLTIFASALYATRPPPVAPGRPALFYPRLRKPINAIFCRRESLAASVTVLARIFAHPGVYIVIIAPCQSAAGEAGIPLRHEIWSLCIPADIKGYAPALLSHNLYRLALHPTPYRIPLLVKLVLELPMRRLSSPSARAAWRVTPAHALPASGPYPYAGHVHRQTQIPQNGLCAGLKSLATATGSTR